MKRVHAFEKSDSEESSCKRIVKYISSDITLNPENGMFTQAGFFLQMQMRQNKELVASQLNNVLKTHLLFSHTLFSCLKIHQLGVHALFSTAM